MSDFARLGAALKNRARAEIVNGVNRNLPPALRVNPKDLDGDEDDGDDEDDGEDGDDGDEDGDDPISLTFEYKEADRNLEAAAAAFRVLGEDGDVVAQYEPDGRAYFGTVEGLVDYCEAQDLRQDGWEVYEGQEVLDLDYDRDAMVQVIRMSEVQSEGYQEARKQYEGFHWGEKSKNVGVKEIPGIVGPVVALGVARRIEYGARKEGSWQEYFHEHGEESGTFPTMYGAGPVDEHGHYQTLVIHGGHMRVEPRGVVD